MQWMSKVVKGMDGTVLGTNRTTTAPAPYIRTEALHNRVGKNPYTRKPLGNRQRGEYAFLSTAFLFIISHGE